MALFRKNKTQPPAAAPEAQKQQSEAQKPKKSWPRRHRKLTYIFATVALAVPWTTVMNREPTFTYQPPDQALTHDTNSVLGWPGNSFFIGAHFTPDKNGNIRFEPFESLPRAWQQVFERSTDVPGFGGVSGKALYDGMPAIPKACVLNLFAKSQATLLPDGTTVLDHLQSFATFRQDRIFVMADDTMARDLDASAQAGTFYHRNFIDSSLHTGHGAFIKYGSYKTRDARGNLDITMTHDGDRWMAEIDIDYFQRGLRHFFGEVMYNHLAHARTNPFAVDDILVGKQGIDPPYVKNAKPPAPPK